VRSRIYQVDAFATQLFAGNPAAVMPLNEFPADSFLLSLAAENNLSETAFLVREGDDYRLRWFTPVTEVPLCGHATLASAAVVMERLEPGRKRVVFHTASGALTVRRTGTGYAMDFPSRPSEPVPASSALVKALGVKPVETLIGPFNHMVVLESAQILRQVAPAMELIASLDRPGVIVTSPGEGKYDFLSRYFAPAKGIPEDPVTGAAHCMLTPYWSKRLGKAELHAFQASRRGGEVVCRLNGHRVELEGACVFYLEGEVDI
jgi:PhzF family phenazine biosynthesis protein